MRHRQLVGLSFSEIAARVGDGMDHTQVSRWSRGIRKLPPEREARVLQVLRDEEIRMNREALATSLGESVLAAASSGKLPATTAKYAFAVAVEGVRRSAESAGFTEGLATAEREQHSRQRFRDRLVAAFTGQPDPGAEGGDAR